MCWWAFHTFVSFTFSLPLSRPVCVCVSICVSFPIQRTSKYMYECASFSEDLFSDYEKKKMEKRRGCRWLRTPLCGVIFCVLLVEPRVFTHISRLFKWANESAVCCALIRYGYKRMCAQVYVPPLWKYINKILYIAKNWYVRSLCALISW